MGTINRAEMRNLVLPIFAIPQHSLKLTHHNKDHDKEEEEEVKSEEGKTSISSEEGFIDASEVDQGADVIPLGPEESVDIPDKVIEGIEKKGKGGKKSGSAPKVSSEITKIKDEINCGFCGVNMSRGGAPTFVPVPNKKIPKNSKGQYKFKSPGSESGKVGGVLCEMCAHNAETLPKGSIDIKTVMVIGQDGIVRNLAVKDL